MNDGDDYTSLQSLLLFQAVAAQKSGTAIFDEISRALKQEPRFLADAKPEDHRFTPEALKNLYLRQAKEEARNQLNESTISRRRVSPMPGSPNQTGNVRHESRTAARMVPKVYARYRHGVVAEIHAEEKRYDSLVQELSTLRNTEDANGAKAGNGLLSRQEVNGQTKHDEDGASRLERPAQSSPVRNGSGSEPEKLPKTDTAVNKPSLQTPPKPRRGNASIDSIMNHDEPQREPPQRNRPPSASVAGPLPLQSFPADATHASNVIQPQQSLNSPYPFRASNSPHLHLGKHGMRQASSPGSVPQGSFASSQSPTTPVILPPPPGMPRPPLPPTSPWNSTHDTSTSAAPRPPSVPISPRSAQPLPHPQDPYGIRDRPPGEHSYRDAWRGQPSQSSSSRPPPYPPYQQQPYAPSPAYRSSYAQPQGGVMLPPFQIQPQAPIQQHSMQMPRHSVGPPSAPRAQSKNIPHPHLNRPAERNSVSTPTGLANLTMQHSPFSTPTTARLLKPGTTVSPNSSTSWKILPGMPKVEQQLLRGVSPLSDPGETPSASNTQQSPPRRGRAAKGTRKSEAQPASIKRTDTSSVRSPSVSSRLDEEAPNQRRSTAKRLKKEPPSTPAVSVSGEDESSPGTARPDRRSGRYNKRKRTASIADTNASDNTPSASFPALLQPQSTNTVVASRNFSKMSKTVLDTIASDKHASIFAGPVNERQAEGYRDIIRRPTDLKTIRGAIANGARAVAAATAEMQSQSQTSPDNNPSGGTVTLTVSEALVPPKGIVNAAQLEQEIMRMFANAVMFNPGGEEIVRDTREMFRVVEGQLQQWRAGMVEGDEEGAGGGAGVGRGEEDVAGGGGAVGGSAKRKRL